VSLSPSLLSDTIADATIRRERPGSPRLELDDGWKDSDREYLSLPSDLGRGRDCGGGPGSPCSSHGSTGSVSSGYSSASRSRRAYKRRLARNRLLYLEQAVTNMAEVVGDMSRTLSAFAKRPVSPRSRAIVPRATTPTRVMAEATPVVVKTRVPIVPAREARTGACAAVLRVAAKIQEEPVLRGLVGLWSGISYYALFHRRVAPAGIPYGLPLASFIASVAVTSAFFVWWLRPINPDPLSECDYD